MPNDLYAENIDKWKDAVAPVFEVDMEKVNRYFSYSYEIIGAMSIEELQEMLWELRRYSLFIRKEYNIVKARSKWLYNTILKVGKPLALEHKSYDKDERLYSAINDNDFLKSIFEKKREFDSKVDVLEDLWKQVDYLINTIDSLVYTKFKINREKKDGNV